MELVSTGLTIVHLLAVIARMRGMIFHIVVLDPVFRKNEVSFQSAYLLALMEGRFRKLVGTSIALLLASGAAKAYLLLGTADAPLHTAAGRYVLLKVGLTAAMLVIFAVCPKTKSCSPTSGSLRRRLRRDPFRQDGRDDPGRPSDPPEGGAGLRTGRPRRRRPARG